MKCMYNIKGGWSLTTHFDQHKIMFEGAVAMLSCWLFLVYRDGSAKSPTLQSCLDQNNTISLA